VAERGTFWKPDRAAGELNVHQVVELQISGECGKAMSLGIPGETGNIIEPHHAVGMIGADRDDQPQLGQP
jgi:hypothetical protein